MTKALTAVVEDDVEEYVSPETVPWKIGRHFEVTMDGTLRVHGDPSFKACERLWEDLLKANRLSQLAIGAAMVYFRERWGEKADQIISDRTGWALETLRNFEWVNKEVPPAIRNLDRGLTFSHLQAVASLPTLQQKKELLDRAAEGEERDGVVKPWPVSTLKQAVKAGTTDLPVIAWGFNATCSSERKRTEAIKLLEGLGIECTPYERRGVKQ